MKKLTLFLALVVAIFMSGCMDKSKSENLLHTSTNTEPYSASLQNSIYIDMVSSGSEKNNSVFDSKYNLVHIQYEVYEEAVITTLVNKGLFSSDGKYKLAINILGMELPSWITGKRFI